MRHSSIHILTACVALGLSASAASAQTTWIVCCHGTGDFLTIQEGINAASHGDLVLVRDGRYTGVGNRDLDFGGRLITVRAEAHDPNCIIDCDGGQTHPHRAFIFQNGEDADGDPPHAVLDGFTIRNGYEVQGGAIRCINGSGPTIRNCVFEDNTVRGGSAYYTGTGGAIQCDGTEEMLIEDCTFLGNRAIGGTVQRTGSAGAIACYAPTGEITIRDCMFRNNVAEGTVYLSGNGGAILFTYGGVLTLTRCTFVGNSTKDNGIDGTGLGGALLTEGRLPDGSWLWTHVEMTDCVFVGNSASWGGAWHPTVRTDASVANCIFVGNKAAFGSGQGIGGAVMVISADTEWRNCLFAGNFALGAGAAMECGAVYGFQNTVSLSNCALVANHAGKHGGGICTYINDLVQCDLHNCVVWGNSPDQLEDQTYSHLMMATYSDVQDGTGELWFGTGCIDADPLFVGGPYGTWTSDGTYDENTGQTTFTDSGANWDPNELVGKLLRPNAEYEPADPNDPNELSGYFQSLITVNTATTVTVWGDFEALGTIGASYKVHDYHVLSDSPVIDAGDNTAVPADELDLDGDGDTTEPIPIDLDRRLRFADRQGTTDTGNGDPPVVDMGAYEYQCDGDLDGDGQIGLADLAQLLTNYGTTSGMTYEDGDIDFDGDVDLADLAALLSVYGTVCG